MFDLRYLLDLGSFRIFGEISGHVSCSCPAWQGPRQCFHTIALEAEWGRIERPAHLDETPLGARICHRPPKAGPRGEGPPQAKAKRWRRQVVLRKPAAGMRVDAEGGCDNSTGTRDQTSPWIQLRIFKKEARTNKLDLAAEVDVAKGSTVGDAARDVARMLGLELASIVLRDLAALCEDPRGGLTAEEWLPSCTRVLHEPHRLWLQPRISGG